MTKQELAKYDFGEKAEEKGRDGAMHQTIQTDKYLESKEKAIELIEGKWGITKGDFWILRNETKSGWILYSGLILSHNGCLKINENLKEEDRFNQKYCSSPIEFQYGENRGLMMEYRDERDGMYEIGEISQVNLKAGGYPYAMLLKRTMDRVILKKSKVAFSGIYSEAESDEFKNEVNNSR